MSNVIRQHRLDERKIGYFPIGAVADSPEADKIFKEEIQISKEKQRLPGKEATATTGVDIKHMRDSLLLLHKCLEGNMLDDGVKNANIDRAKSRMGNVRSLYTMPLTNKPIYLVTNFEHKIDTDESSKTYGRLTFFAFTTISIQEEVE